MVSCANKEATDLNEFRYLISSVGDAYLELVGPRAHSAVIRVLQLAVGNLIVEVYLLSFGCFDSFTIDYTDN